MAAAVRAAGFFPGLFGASAGEIREAGNRHSGPSGSWGPARGLQTPGGKKPESATPDSSRQIPSCLHLRCDLARARALSGSQGPGL